MATDHELVRHYIDDLDIENPIVTDTHIDTMLEIYGEPEETAAVIAEMLALRFARVATISIDGLTIDGNAIAEQYRNLARNIRRGTRAGMGSPFISGISIGGVKAVDTDVDRVDDKFSVGQDDFL